MDGKKIEEDFNRSTPESSMSNPQQKTRLQHKRHDRFSDLAGITILFRPINYDFKDDEWIGKSGIALERYTDESIASMGRSVIPMLCSAFTEQGFALVFILAYHLKSPGSNFRQYLYNLDDHHNLIMTDDKNYMEFSNVVKSVSSGGGYNTTIMSDVVREAAVYSYIAASLFRLFVKPASSYVKGWFSIVNGFSKWYGGGMVNVRLPVPTEAALDQLRRWFSIKGWAKVMLYRFLYMSNSEEWRYKGLKAFLYDNYLLNSGMHIVGIVTDLADVLKCDPMLIVKTIEARHIEREVRCLVRVLELLNTNDENYRRKMWRYGRIFDESFMSDLQTKSCPKLVYVLAEALRSEEPEKHSGILQIAQLADLSAADKLRCVTIAQRLLATLKGGSSGRGKEKVT